MEFFSLSRFARLRPFSASKTRQHSSHFIAALLLFHASRVSQVGREDLGESGKVVKVMVDVRLNGGHWTDGKSGVTDVSYTK